MITKEALSNKYANKEQELCLYEFVVVIVLYYGFTETWLYISSETCIDNWIVSTLKMYK